MNGAKKFHSPDGPAFNKGEVWEACDGSGVTVEIDYTERWGTEKWDVDVLYTCGNSKFVRNAWAFQVRYQHQADKELQKQFERYLEGPL